MHNCPLIAPASLLRPRPFRLPRLPLDGISTAPPATLHARTITLANRHPRLRLDRRAVTRVIHLLDSEFAPRVPVAESKIKNRNSKFLSAPPGELSLVFLTDAELAQLHADFLDDPTPTDVITFEGAPAFGTAGEICVSADAARREISRRRRLTHAAALRAFSTELTLYVVHGWLHLAGYEDLQPAKKRVMRRAEARALKILRAHDCLPRFTLR